MWPYLVLGGAAVAVAYAYYRGWRRRQAEREEAERKAEELIEAARRRTEADGKRYEVLRRRYEEVAAENVRKQEALDELKSELMAFIAEMRADGELTTADSLLRTARTPNPFAFPAAAVAAIHLPRISDLQLGARAAIRSLAESASRTGSRIAELRLARLRLADDAAGLLTAIEQPRFPHEEPGG